MKQILKLFIIAVALVTAIPSFAVTDREMEQARVMAAKHYLRYANNGSDYLDKITPSSMSDLTKSLKAKEQENIKSFNAVAVPKDYASWDKAKLVEYWSNTFFKSPGLNQDGKRCLSFLAKDLAKIEVKAPGATPAASQPQPTGQPADKQTREADHAAAPAAAAATETPAQPAGEELVAQAAADSPAQELEEEHPQKPTGTIWYVVILVVLIGVVVWLVMYAQKSMKETGQIVADHKNGEKEIREAKRMAKEEINKMRDQYAASISAKNDEIKQLRAKCESLEEQLAKVRKQEPAESPAPSRQGSRDVQGSPNSRDSHNNTLPPVVYLGGVNQRGLFVKASRSLNAEHSVYRMDIPDGVHGTFRVLSDSAVLDRLLADPDRWLAGGCEIENPGDADIATEIVTMSPGQALFSDNTCRVVRKARVKFI